MWHLVASPEPGAGPAGPPKRMTGASPHLVDSPRSAFSNPVHRCHLAGAGCPRGYEAHGDTCQSTTPRGPDAALRRCQAQQTSRAHVPVGCRPLRAGTPHCGRRALWPAGRAHHPARALGTQRQVPRLGLTSATVVEPVANFAAPREVEWTGARVSRAACPGVTVRPGLPVWRPMSVTVSPRPAMCPRQPGSGRREGTAAVYSGGLSRG